jgi:hypothetical protein
MVVPSMDTKNEKDPPVRPLPLMPLAITVGLRAAVAGTTAWLAVHQHELEAQDEWHRPGKVHSVAPGPLRSPHPSHARVPASPAGSECRNRRAGAAPLRLAESHLRPMPEFEKPDPARPRKQTPSPRPLCGSLDELVQAAPLIRPSPIPPRWSKRHAASSGHQMPASGKRTVRPPCSVALRGGRPVSPKQGGPKLGQPHWEQANA